jgi:hypothetical protein
MSRPRDRSEWLSSRTGRTASGARERNPSSQSKLYAQFRILAAHRARALPVRSPPKMPRAQGRPGAGWHPRSTVRRLRYKRLHSGIQVKPNTRPSLRSGFTAYVALSPGSDALLPPSPCGWLMLRTRSGRHITATLGAQTPGARTTRFCRTQAAPVVCATPSLTVSRPAKPFAPTPPASTTFPSRVRDDRDPPLGRVGMALYMVIRNTDKEKYFCVA